jgi:hypothetical protein
VVLVDSTTVVQAETIDFYNRLHLLAVGMMMTYRLIDKIVVDGKLSRWWQKLQKDMCLF